MKIGMILDQEFPPDARVENEAISLINGGHQVFLFCLSYQKNNCFELVYKKIRVKRYLSSRLEDKLSALVYTLGLYTFFMQRKIANFIKNNSLDALHIHDIRIAQAVFNVNKHYKLPVVLDLHENRPEIMKYYPHLQKLYGKLLIFPRKWKLKEEEFIRKSSRIIVVTEEAKAEILSRVEVNKDKIIALPNTVREDFYTDQKPLKSVSNTYKNNFVMLYIGDTGIRRGLTTAIESVKILQKKIPNIKLVIVGKSSSDFILKKLIKKLQIEKHIDFLGWKDANLLPSYILTSHLCISPLHRNIHHDTTYANKIFQYMSLGKPLLVSDATAQKRLIIKLNSGLVHKEKDTKDFVQKVNMLYKNSSLRDRFGVNGAEFIKEKFSWTHTSKKLLELYKNLSC